MIEFGIKDNCEKPKKVVFELKIDDNTSGGKGDIDLWIHNPETGEKQLVLFIKKGTGKLNKQILTKRWAIEALNVDDNGRIKTKDN